MVGDSHAIRFASYRLRSALCMCGTHDLGRFFGGAMSRARRLFGRGLSVECRPLRRQAWLSPYRRRRRRSGSIAYRRSFCAERRPRCQAAAPTLTSAAKKHAPVIDVLHLGLKLFLLFYYAPLFCAHFRIEPVFSWFISSRLLLFWAAVLAVVRDLVFWHVEEI